MSRAQLISKIVVAKKSQIINTTSLTTTLQAAKELELVESIAKSMRSACLFKMSKNRGCPSGHGDIRHRGCTMTFAPMLVEN
jgi:hypothetical protein